MTMSAAEVRKRQEKSAEKRGSSTNYLKIEDGDEIRVRIGPPWKAEGEIWKDRLIHGGFDKKVYCAQNDVDEKTGKKRKCKVCKRVAELKDDRSTFGKKLWALIHQRAEGLWNAAKVKDMDGKVAARYEDKTFKVLQLSTKWHGLLLDIFAEEEYREGKAGILGITHPKYGRLIKIKRTGKGRDDTKYTFMPATTETPVLADKSKRKKMMGTVVNLDKLARGSSDEELSSFLHQAEKTAKKLAKEEKNKKESSSGSDASKSSSDDDESKKSESEKESESKASDSSSLDSKYEKAKKMAKGDSDESESKE